MDQNEKVEVKIIGEEKLIKALKEELDAKHDEAEVISSGPAKDPTLLHFGLVEVAAIATIIRTSFLLGEMALKIYKHLKDRKSGGIIIQTALGREELSCGKDLTIDDVKQALNRLLENRE